MSRKYIDCRESPNIVGCTLKISGEEEEVLEAAVKHAVSKHGEQESPELVEEIRSSLKEETEGYRGLEQPSAQV